MEKREIAYYLEDLNRVRSLSFEQLGEWKAKYPYSQMVHFLMAKKYQLEGLTEDMSVFHKASFYAVDREHLFERMTNSECEREEETDWIEIEELSIENLPLEVKQEEAPDAIQKQSLKDIKDEEMTERQDGHDLLSPFAQWLSTLSPEASDSDLLSAQSEKRKAKKKKKKKKKGTKKTDLEEKIKSSVLIQDEIVSEPLALILAQQGHRGKAIKMYEKLSLIFPEKSSFFASQIEKLNNSN